MDEKQARELVLQWHGPVYNLALRMFGNAADAADGTQEVFVTVFRKLDRYDPSRPFRPWLFRVARNVLLNLIRDRQLARERERESAVNPPAAPSRDRELSSVVAARLEDLEPEQRSLLLLHYYHDVSQVELAEILEIPRTTVQSRLGRALDALRASLRAGGHLAAIPAVESIMRGTPSVPVPESLTSSLLTTASTAATGVSMVGAGSILGGMAVKKLVVIAAVVCIVSATVGWLGGRASVDDTQTAAEGQGADTAVASVTEKLARLQEDHDALSARLTEVEAERAALAARNANLKEKLIARSTSDATNDPATAAADTEPAGDAGGALNWAHFSELFADGHSIIAQVLHAEDGGERLNAEEQAQLYSAAAEFTRLAGQARKLSDAPLFDEEILTGLTRALFEQPLELTEAQTRDLERITRNTLRDTLARTDVDRLTPIELATARDDLLDDLQDSLAGVLDDEQRARWERLEVVVDHLLEGSRREVEKGIAGWSDTQFEDYVLDEWRQAYALDEEQLPLVRPSAQDWKRKLDEFFATADEADSAAGDPGSEEFRRAQRDIQIAVERGILAFLTNEQLDRIPDAVPTLLVFRPEQGTEEISVRRSPGF